MKKNWASCLKTILQRVGLEAEQIDRKINKGIKELMHRSKILEPYDPSISSYILLPCFHSAYIISFLLILPEEGLLYDCAEDEKTGAGDHFEQYTLTEQEVKTIKNIKWPTLFMGASSRARASRPFQHVIND